MSIIVTDLDHDDPESSWSISDYVC